MPANGTAGTAVTLFVSAPANSGPFNWNFGDGHLHNEQLIEALQERCRFDEGEVRVIILDGQPIHRQRQAYRLVDAATGEALPYGLWTLGEEQALGIAVLTA